MNQFLNSVRNNHDNIFKVILALISLLTIVYLLPKEATFKYEFEKGKPWLHETLLAPFDFAIQKPESQIAKEKAEIKVSKKPYFSFNEKDIVLVHQRYTEGVDLYLEELDTEQRAALNVDEKPIQKRLKEVGLQIIDSLYSKGIIEKSEVLDSLSNYDVIVVLKNHTEEDHEVSYYYTLQSAYEWITAFPLEEPEMVSSVIKNLIVENLKPNITFDREWTDKVLNEQLSNVSPTFDKVSKSEKIVERGEIINDISYQKLVSLKKKYEKRIGGSNVYWYILLGQILLVAISLAVLLIYLKLFRKDVFNETYKYSFIIVFYSLIVYMAGVSLYFPEINIYILPFCLLPIVIRTFFDARIAAFIHVMSMTLLGLLAPNGFEFVFIQIMTGMIALFSLISMRKRSQLLLSVLTIFIAYSINYLGFTIIKEGNINSINWYNFAWFGGNAILTLLAYPLIFIFEKVFGMISDVTLMELSDTNSPLLRKLASVAPGTFQHSMQVANLAEEAVIAIDGDPLLVRTGALYHDIGKMSDPAFFIENQAGGFNPHDNLSYEESARIIIGHVLNGIEMAKKEKLPEQIIDFIRTHHGTTVTRYFYNMARKENPDIEIEKFQYPGPPPYSKETAVLMMSDSVEAASRSLKEYNADTIGNLVENIINAQLGEHQFDNANITLQDIKTIKKIFKKKLMNIYHVRIEYPK